MMMLRLAALILWVLITTGNSDVLASQDGRLKLQGSIRSSDGRPLQGDVTVVESGPTVRVSSYQSDREGRFSFEANAGRPITVVAKADGYSSSERNFLPGTTSTIDFVLSLIGKVSGRAIDETGRGLAGATVSVRYLGRQRSQQFSQEVGDVTTDDFGYFTLPFVERGPAFVIDVVAPGRLMASSWPMGLSAEAIAGVLVTAADNGQLVFGKVVDPMGQPLPGVSVRLRWFDKDETEDVERERNNSLTAMRQANRMALTDTDGAFAFADVPEGSVIIVASRRDVKPAKVEGNVSSSAPLEVILVLH